MPKRPTTDGANTLPLTVQNTGFLLDRLGQDCHPLQFLRELTQNAIEAIHRTKAKTGEIVWDVVWMSYVLVSGVYMLYITDTVVGLIGDEIVSLYNQLFYSLIHQLFT